ncbi:hypothetical protein ACS25C_17275 [Dickeya undicola]|uniref:hypothetical protein n=1 Tax=Dickeya undicola TaxID=1577887 RepID=UPI003F1F2EEE
MKIINNSILIDMDLTDEVLEELTLHLTNQNDITLEIRNTKITAKNIEVPKAVNILYIEDCLFTAPTIISNLKEGKLFSIVNCRRDFFLGNVRIKNIDCCNLIINQEKIKDINECLSPDIEESIIEYFKCYIDSPPVFSNVYFGREATISNVHAMKSIVFDLFFNDCKFLTRFQLTINVTSPIIISMKNCNVFYPEEDADEELAFIYFTEKSIIRKLIISESELDSVKFSLFSATIKNVTVTNSTVGELDLSTVEKEDNKDENNNSIYNITIVDSFLGKISFKYRKIVHEVNFSNTTFATPPQMQGANIPEGSELPNKSHFISRKGQHDASCYRTMRFIMESQRNRELEGMFFSLEQESLLNQKSKMKKYFSISYLYYILSDYGTNYKTPLYVLLSSIPFFTIIYSLINSLAISIYLPIDWNIIIKSFTIALKQTFLPFEILRNIEIETENNTFLALIFMISGIIHSILSVSLLALSGIALRWKFKRGN